MMIDINTVQPQDLEVYTNEELDAIKEHYKKKLGELARLVRNQKSKNNYLENKIREQNT